MAEKKYSKEFRLEAVKQVIVLEHSVKSVAERLGVPKQKIENWVFSHKKAKTKVDLDDWENVLQENRQLKIELKKTRDELKALKNRV